MMGKSIKELNIGDEASMSRTVTEADVILFGGVSGDFNPAHFDEEYARKTLFKGRIAHGMIAASYATAVLAMKLPGPGSIYLGQEMKFLAPVRFGDTVIAKVEVLEKNEGKNRVILRTYCTNQDGKLILDGKATILPPIK
ncbi:MaoC family dehydratase [Crassaminicella profunda]|uniref:MaoC family dehydratase n=1 Tax=Crassaminicella profunda TaxID=1286698 RepID=UPI001CA72E17|nr:MaoC family dehydratase [Crassaminicella profunda]QZY54078.1 MaoC family dehydratase [Crassaminicella profunda]